MASSPISQTLAAAFAQQREQFRSAIINQVRSEIAGEFLPVLRVCAGDRAALVVIAEFFAVRVSDLSGKTPAQIQVLLDQRMAAIAAQGAASSQ